MPVQASSRNLVPMPTFMSVFGEEEAINKELGRSGAASHGAQTIRPASSGNISSSSPPNASFSTFHVHRDSTSTLASESSDSSPTTTISTMDSSSVTDPSPGPSPESPIAKIAPSSFVADFRSRRTDSNSLDPSQNTFFELQRPTTPAKKPRNLKNLGINTASSLSNLRCNPTAPLPMVEKKEKNISAPTSPSFIKPPTPPKRRPSNLSLTIQTPGSDPKPMRLVIPSTPAFNRPALRHFQSSPSLPLVSPAIAPAGGMQLPPLRPVKTNPHGFAEVAEEDEDLEPNFDVPQSREEKPAAYPNGPICIYESGVYLYFEPTTEQATDFDVIFNVASEVKNPFTTENAGGPQQNIDQRRQDGPPAENPDFAALPQRPKSSSVDIQGSSPTTPKGPAVEISHAPAQQADGNKNKVPEYIHIPWEHNTDIVADLYKLVKIIDERVQQGKRVLIHCQCGVSRSASLIVAYGLYKNPGISVQEAYDAAKKRSKWIGPNMNLIMQLQEFRNGLLRANRDRTYYNQVFGLSLPTKSSGLPSSISNGTGRHSPFERDSSGSRTPRTAPLPPDNDTSLQRASTGNIMALSPGPLSAPMNPFFSPGFRRSWASSQTHFDLSPKASSVATTPYVDPKGHVVPVLSVTQNDQQNTKLPEPQLAESEQHANFKSLPVPNFSRQLPPKKLAGTTQVDNDPPIVSPGSDAFHTAPLPPDDSASVFSPTTSTFNIPDTLSAPHSPNPFGIMSPTATTFNLEPLPHSQRAPLSDPAVHPSSQSSTEHAREDEFPMSPRSTEFHMTGLNHSSYDDSFGLLSPRASSFDVGSIDSLQKQSEPTAPQRSSFMQDDATIDSSQVASPRETEFHMTSLVPKVAYEDPFGLTSPKRFEFSSNPFETSELAPQHDETESRRPSIQAIHPPSSLAQPEIVNGFASLNGSTLFQPPVTLSNLAPQAKSSSDSRIDSLSTSPEPQTPASKPIGQKSWTDERPSFTTPPKQPTSIRTRFSSPNMREQRKLHKLQTEMEALLPPKPAQAVDDLDALMSPRATEFTKNPFHVDLASPVEDPSPASSTETIKENKERREWTTSQEWTQTRAVEEDPRSPVQKGGSPIVRSIFDVL